MENTRRLTRKERRLAHSRGYKDQETSVNQEKLNFKLKNIEPLTKNQRLTFSNFELDFNLMLHGTAGTGKSFIAVYLALNQVLSENSRYNKVIIVRTAVPGRDQGFVPGKQQEKNAVYELPYQAIFSELFSRGDAYQYLKQKGVVEFMTTSFIRGITLNNCIIIFDECQNSTLHECDSVITRVGKNCKIIFSGDFKQTDFMKEKSGLLSFMRIIKNMKSFFFVEFETADILRSSVVKEYITEKEKLGITT